MATKKNAKAGAKAQAENQEHREEAGAKAPVVEAPVAAAELTVEELEQQAKARFEAKVAEAVEDPTAALAFMMDKHTVAVTARSAHDAAKNAFDTRNSKSLESIKSSQVRLAVARTDILNQWNDSVGSNGEEITVGEGEEARTYIAGLDFGFDDGSDEGPEKEYWLAAQSYNRIAASIAKEPAELSALRGASDEAQAEYDEAHAIYLEAIKSQM